MAAHNTRSPPDARPAPQLVGSSRLGRIPHPLGGGTDRRQWNRRTRAWGEDAGGLVNGSLPEGLNRRKMRDACDALGRYQENEQLSHELVVEIYQILTKPLGE